MSGKRHPFHASWEVGFDDDGLITGLQATLTSDGGWSLDLSEPVLARALCHIDNAYWIPNIEAHGRIAKTNKTSQTAFRGFGGPQGMIVIEDILGRCAPLLGLPAEDAAAPQPLPAPVRRRRTVSRSAIPSGWPTSGRSCSTRPTTRARLAELEAFNAEHPHTKRGLAITPVKFGISFNLTAFNQAGALVHVYKDGSVLINHGGTEMGQGLHTKMIQVAATALGRAAVVRSGWPRPGPTRCPTPPPPRRPPAPTSTAARSRTPVTRSASGWPRWRRRKLNIHPADVRFHDGMVTGIGFHDRRDHLRRAGPRGLLPAGLAVGGRLLPHRGSALGRGADAGRAVQVLRLRGGAVRGRGRRLHRRLPVPAHRHRARRRRQPVAADRRRADRGRLRPGRRLADPGAAALGRRRRPEPGPAEHPGGLDVQAAQLLGDAGGRSTSTCTRRPPSPVWCTGPRRSASRR